MTRMCFNLSVFASAVTFIHLFAYEIAASPIIEDCPRIVSREEWKARNATSSYQQLDYTPAPYIVIHHGGLLHYCYDEPGCADIVRSYQNLHIDNRGWIDIGYNFVIGEDGNVYEGRGWDHIGAHSPGYNTQSIGVSVIGDFSHFIPNSPALKALKSLIVCGVYLGKVSNDYQIIGHTQARKTVCPGEVFYNWVQKMPGWTNRPIPIFQSSITSSSSSNDTNGADKIQGNTADNANLPFVQSA